MKLNNKLVSICSVIFNEVLLNMHEKETWWLQNGLLIEILMPEHYFFIKMKNNGLRSVQEHENEEVTFYNSFTLVILLFCTLYLEESE